MRAFGNTVWDEHLDRMDGGVSGKRVRYRVAGWHNSPDIVEYPDEGTFAAFAKTHSQLGEPFRVRQPLQRQDG